MSYSTLLRLPSPPEADLDLTTLQSVYDQHPSSP
jgi:hypothetical protein